MPSHPTIFVQIASYRDPECQWTVRDLFAKAKYPDRVTVGICWQSDPEQDKHCFIEPTPRAAQTKVIFSSPSESLGVCWARAKAQKLFNDEDYVLMIDSHMRFIQDWDEALIEELKKCPSPKAFLSTYPPGYKPPDQLVPNPRPIVLRANPFTEMGDIRFEGETLDGEVPESPLRGAFLAAGFVFAPGSFVREVPYDPQIYFDHEEVTIAARAFTYGWDVYSPPGTFVYHYYHEPQKGETRALHWSDNRDWGKLQILSRARYQYLLTGVVDKDQPVALTDIEKYGLGSVRSIQDFEEYTGIDFKAKTVSLKARNALFVQDIERYRKVAAAPLSAGAVIPPFRVQDDTEAWFSADDFAGQGKILCVLPSHFGAYIQEFLALYQEMRAAFETYGARLVFVMPTADANAGLCQILGISSTIHDTPYSYILDKDRKVVGFYNNRNASNHIHDLLRAAESCS